MGGAELKVAGCFLLTFWACTLQQLRVFTGAVVEPSTNLEGAQGSSYLCCQSSHPCCPKVKKLPVTPLQRNSYWLESLLKRINNWFHNLATSLTPNSQCVTLNPPHLNIIFEIGLLSPKHKWIYVGKTQAKGPEQRNLEKKSDERGGCKKLAQLCLSEAIYSSLKTLICFNKHWISF